MNIKGSCYFSHIHNKHVIVILLESDKTVPALIILTAPKPFTAVKLNTGRHKALQKPYTLLQC